MKLQILRHTGKFESVTEEQEIDGEIKSVEVKKEIFEPVREYILESTDEKEIARFRYMAGLVKQDIEQEEKITIKRH